VSATVDAQTLATLIAKYHGSDLMLFEVSREFVAEKYETWSGPMAFRFVREEGALVRLELKLLEWTVECPSCDGHGFQAGAHTERVVDCPRCDGKGAVPAVGTATQPMIQARFTA
jgi:hypothetical protein